MLPEQVREADATKSDAARGPVLSAVHGAAPLRATVITADHRSKPTTSTPAQVSHITAGKG